jgi:hypothetical protein
LGIDDPMSPWLQGFYRTVNALRDISTIAALVDLIDKKDGIKVHWMIRPGDLGQRCLETFYRMLSDFPPSKLFRWSIPGSIFLLQDHDRRQLQLKSCDFSLTI